MNIYRLHFFIVLLSAIFFFSACKDCKTCTRTSVPEIEVCKSDYIEKDLYNRALEGFESSGYTCE